MDRESVLRDAFAKQAQWCTRLGSPFTARLMEGLGRQLDRETVSGRKIFDWPGQADAHGDSVPLRLAGALNALVRRGRVPDLARLYPPNPLPDLETLSGAALAALADADAEIAEWLEFPPQTNEVARSGILYPGLAVIAAETGLPLSLFEVGTSAGLNLIPDRYAYRLGGAALGREGSQVLLQPKWTGDKPPAMEPRIVSRRGCDRNPLNVADAAHRERLMAYIWPDQAERISRAEAAIALARADPPPIDSADAADWVEAVIDEGAVEGVVRVLFHSIAFQYFPDDIRSRIDAKMEAAGARANDRAPLAWLAYEQYESDGPRLTLRLRPGGGERILASGNAHVQDVCWLDAN
ncbi:MAG TPA: DUF2332 family protein [Afifellaceae bacterium]|nr:DUF2332 family protein [Afifellaceae bacterium]